MLRINTTQIPHQILDMICQGKLTQRESRMILFICRKTIGWNKETDWLTLEYIHKNTNLDPAHISRTLRALLEKGLITRSGHEGHYVWGIHFEGLPKEQVGVAKRANGRLPKEQATIDTITNDTNTKHLHSRKRKLTKSEVERLRMGIVPL